MSERQDFTGRFIDFGDRLGLWFLARASEKSTYAGFALLAVIHGGSIPPAVMDALTWWGPFLAAGLIAASTGEGK